ncbi:MAG: NADH-quinone oxidoreductase subunit L [Nannocystaceae bacterium]|nr:NADH-quinone oxidoreductase subunit L [Nannocystaceae bacterium]
MNGLDAWTLVHLAALAVPVAFAAVAAFAPLQATRASAFALVVAALVAAATAGVFGPPPSPLLGLRLDGVTAVMLALVALLGFVVVRFSRTHLQGEPALPRYFRWLSTTLAAVTAIVLADDLLAIALAWTVTSVALHQLLTFYPTRAAALIAAHKKFLVSRLADVCLAGSLALVHTTVGSLALDDIAAAVATWPSLPLAMELAAALLVCAVALRSAQLPFHGWLTQVMEAPTPVSALLHAGVVNIGGLVLIRVAPWIAQAVAAQWLLIAIGLVTALVAATVMTTRVSIKVALAWSTCAQMGFMLVQCGLGAWSAALLHIVAHSLYKAHAFLDAGSVVARWQQRAMTPAPARPGAGALAWAGVGIASSFAATTALDLGPAGTWPALVSSVLVGLALLPLQRGSATALRVLAVVLLSCAWHVVLSELVATAHAPANPLAWALTGVAFVGFAAVHLALRRHPHGRLARRLHPWLFAGLYLDERFTRLSFRIWPPRRPEAPSSPRPMPLRTSMETRT